MPNLCSPDERYALASVLGCYLRELLLCRYSLWTRVAVL